MESIQEPSLPHCSFLRCATTISATTHETIPQSAVTHALKDIFGRVVVIIIVGVALSFVSFVTFVHGWIVEASSFSFSFSIVVPLALVSVVCGPKQDKTLEIKNICSNTSTNRHKSHVPPYRWCPG